MSLNFSELRGFEFTHETVRDWEARFAPIFATQLRAKRKGSEQLFVNRVQQLQSIFQAA